MRWSKQENDAFKKFRAFLESFAVLLPHKALDR
jgi:hypothetical protein